MHPGGIFRGIATDYDGTVATEGRFDAVARAALVRVRERGYATVLVTGRHLADLRSVFAEEALFDRLVLENGAVIVDPSDGRERLLAEPPDPRLFERLAAERVPYGRGHVIVGTHELHGAALRDAIRALALPMHLVRNASSVMALPSGIDKASGMRAALRELGIAESEAIGIGDAQNDVVLLEACGLGVAVANALPMTRAIADLVTAGERGDGFAELANRWLDDPAGLARLARP